MPSKKDIRENIGIRIRYERERRNMSIDELAAMLYLSTAFIGLVERGQRGLQLYNLVRIAEVFELSLDELILEKPTLNLNKEEISISATAQKQATIRSVLYSLPPENLDFIIAVIRALRLMEQNKLKN